MEFRIQAKSTSVFVLDKDTASALNERKNLDLFEGMSISQADVQVSGGSVVELPRLKARKMTKNFGKAHLKMLRI